VIDKYEENADLLNFYEKMVLLAYPRLVGAVQNASSRVKDLEFSYVGKKNNSLNRGDAFRHIMWSYLLCKYAADRNDNIAESITFAKRFTDAHEKTPSKLLTYDERQLITKWIIIIMLLGELSFKKMLLTIKKIYSGQKYNLKESILWVMKFGGICYKMEFIKNVLLKQKCC